MATEMLTKVDNGGALADLDLQGGVAELLDRWPSAGLAVGVVRDGSLEWFLGHGFADVRSREPITEETVFRVGSLTKTFTAIAVMQLWEQGLVDLDAPASEYLRGGRSCETGRDVRGKRSPARRNRCKRGVFSSSC